MNLAFEARVLKVFASGFPLPPDAPVPPELLQHGSVVIREAAERRRMAAVGHGRWCGACHCWYPVLVEHPNCPHCGSARPGYVMREGSAYESVAREAGTVGRGKVPVVHARVTERWLRGGPDHFERQPGELLCRSDRHTRIGQMQRTDDAVTCGLCLAKIRAHMGGADA
ncbi:MAG: hypothetical protein ABFD89_21350 [Bryobacteraceae bacterium]